MARKGRGKVDWVGDIGSAAGIAVTNVTPLTLAEGEPVTVLRTYLAGVLNLNAAAGTERGMVGIGVIVANSQAVAAGSASLPSPTDDLDAPWLLHAMFGYDAGGTIGEGVFARFDGVDALQSKAMRKVSRNEALVVNVDHIRLAGTATIDFVGGIRVLQDRG